MLSTNKHLMIALALMTFLAGFKCSEDSPGRIFHKQAVSHTDFSSCTSGIVGLDFIRYNMAKIFK